MTASSTRTTSTSVCVEADMVFQSRSEADACAESLGLDARKEY